MHVTLDKLIFIELEKKRKINIKNRKLFGSKLEKNMKQTIGPQ